MADYSALSKLLNGYQDPNDPSAEQMSVFNQMASQAAPIPSAPPQQLPPPPTPSSLSQNPVSPQALTDATRSDMFKRFKQWGNQRDLEMDKIKQYMQDYSQLNQGTDYRPIASFIGSLGQGNKQLYDAAAATAPEAPQTKAENLLGFQQKNVQLANEAANANAMAKLLQNQQQAQYQNARAGVMQQGLDLRRDKLAQDMGNKIDTDPILQGIFKQQNQIAIDKHTLDSAPILTPQIFNELQQGLSNAIAGGKQSALGNLERTEYATAETNLQALKQRLLNKPQDINSPEIKQVLSDTFERLNKGYAYNAQSRANQIVGGREVGLNSSPQAKEVLNKKVQALQVPEGEATAPTKSVVKMKAPDGSIRMVPSTMIDQAKQAGGEVIP